jgi:hypothetical protein
MIPSVAIEIAPPLPFCVSARIWLPPSITSSSAPEISMSPPRPWPTLDVIWLASRRTTASVAAIAMLPSRSSPGPDLCANAVICACDSSTCCASIAIEPAAPGLARRARARRGAVHEQRAAGASESAPTSSAMLPPLPAPFVVAAIAPPSRRVRLGVATWICPAFPTCARARTC